MHFSGQQLVEWDIYEHCAYTGELLSHKKGPNLIIDTGKIQFFRNNFGMAGSGIFKYMAVGASGVYNGSMTAGATATDTRLTYELTGNATRYALQGAVSAAWPPTTADQIAESITIGGIPYTQKIVLSITMPSIDGNNGNSIVEYGVNTLATLPGSPTSVSGVMGNRFIDPAPIFKTSANSVTSQMTFRY